MAWQHTVTQTAFALAQTLAIGSAAHAQALSAKRGNLSAYHSWHAGRMQRLRRRLLRFGMSLALLAAASASLGIANAQQQETFLSFVSQPGDFIGLGQSLTFTPSDSQFTAQVSQDNREIAVNISTTPELGSFWFLNLAAPTGQQLQPGLYEDAARWPFQGPLQPGLDFSGDGRGCNTLTGRFQVIEAVFHPFGYVERFHATFEQHCEGAEPALFGEIKIVNPPPPPPLTLELKLERQAQVQRANGRVTVQGTISCSQPATVQLFGTVTQRASRFVLVTGNFSEEVQCSAEPVSWSAQTTGGGLPFNPGAAEVDVSASAIDPNFGVLVTARVSGLVKVKPSRR